ncbi:MAG: YhjD/YihY/BrkB family envelope integrity protein [Chthoniobacterales bacterium]
MGTAHERLLLGSGTITITSKSGRASLSLSLSHSRWCETLSSRGADGFVSIVSRHHHWRRCSHPLPRRPLLLVIFKILPDAKVRWRDVWVGAFLTAPLFAFGKWALTLYLGSGAAASASFSASSLITLLL